MQYGAMGAGAHLRRVEDSNYRQCHPRKTTQGNTVSGFVPFKVISVLLSGRSFAECHEVLPTTGQHEFPAATRTRS